MKEIKELEDKYLVLKWGDIRNQTIRDSIEMDCLIQKIQSYREDQGKIRNPKYLVLNLDDEIDCTYFLDAWHNKIPKTHTISTCRVKVSKVAVYLVNAILKTKDKQ